MRIVVRPQRRPKQYEPEGPQEGLDLYTGQTLDQPAEEAPKPVLTSYTNPFYRLDLELKKRGFRRLKSPNYLNAAQGRREGSYPGQPRGRFSDYNGTVYVREPAPNYIWVAAAWIPQEPLKTASGDLWCAYWSPTPDGVISKCGKTQDEAVDILFDLIPSATHGDEKGKTMRVNLPQRPEDLTQARANLSDPSQGQKMRDASYWWESLTAQQRDAYLKGETWSGTEEERRLRLLRFYNSAHPATEPMNLNLPPPGEVYWPTPSGEIIVPTKEGADLMRGDDVNNIAHVRLETGLSAGVEITVDVFYGGRQPTESDHFPATVQGAREATHYLREHGYRQTISLK